MSHSWQNRKPKNRQWRIIIWSSLFLIFTKPLALFLYHALHIDQAYAATTNMATRVGLREVLGTSKDVFGVTNQLVIDVKNDTPSEYTLDSKIISGQLNFLGKTFATGEIKRFTVRPDASSKKALGVGDILFLSAPMAGNNNTICREIHTLFYDLKYANQVKQPFFVNLSSIASRLECK